MRRSVRQKSKRRSTKRRSKRKSTRRSKRKSTKRKSRRRSVRMRWASPGGSIYPNKNGEGDGADVQIGIIANSYNEYKGEDIQTVLRLIENGEWSDSYLNALTPFFNVNNALVVALRSGNTTAVKRIANTLATHPMINDMIEYGFWDKRLLKDGETNLHILEYIRTASQYMNLGALKDLIKWQKDRDGFQQVIGMAIREKNKYLKYYLEEEYPEEYSEEYSKYRSRYRRR